MRKAAKIARFITILIYFLAISGVNTRTVSAAQGCSAAIGNGHFTDTGDYVCDGKVSPVNPSPAFSTLPSGGDNAKKPDEFKPITGANAPIFGSSGNDCERQAMVGATRLQANGKKGYLTAATAPGSIGIGDQIVIAGATPAKFNGTFTVTAISGNQITYDIPGSNPNAVSPMETATGSAITVRPDNVAAGQNCIDQMTQQIDDLQNRIDQMNLELDPMMSQIRNDMQRMDLSQQQQYAQGLQEMLNQFLGGGSGTLSGNGSHPFSSMMGQLNNTASSSPADSGNPATANASYKSGAGGQKAVGGFDKCVTSGGDAATGAKKNDTFQQVTDMLGSREGFTNTAGWDNIHYTNGIGHLCSSGECTKGTYWSNDKVIEVFKQDLSKFWPAAQKQVDSLCINDSCFFTHIMSVCWQLGPNWTTGQGNNGRSRPGLREAWQAMQQGNFTQAIQHIERARSWWTTKNRVTDLVVALKSMIGQPTCGGKTIV